MKIYVNFDINAICISALEKQLNGFGLEYTLSGSDEIQVHSDLSEEGQQELADALRAEGIFIIDDTKSKLVHRIKEAITQMIYSDVAYRYKTSTYLSEKLNYSYSHLSEVFSQTTLGSIENFIILKKIDYAKKLMVEGHFTFSEIAHKLNYSSSSHLSAQFKKNTGLTPSHFQRLIQQRKERRRHYADARM